MRHCDCNDWKENVEIIDTALILAFTHGFKAIIKVFEICPWCGKRLANVENDD